MAYKTAELLKKAIEVTKKHNLYFIEDIVTFMPCSKKTFYDHNLHESPEIKSALEDNRVSMKLKLRKKWAESDTPALQVGLMKLLCNDDERRKLSVSHVEAKVSSSPAFVMYDAREPSKKPKPTKKK